MNTHHPLLRQPAINFSITWLSSQQRPLTYIMQLRGLTKTSTHTSVDLRQTTYLHRPTLNLSTNYLTLGETPDHLMT
jgi:hypothetical protein